MTKGRPYRFNVVNCEKTNSQFNYGMQPLLYSELEAVGGRPGWTRAGSHISYYKNNFYTDCRVEGKRDREKGDGRKMYYSLAFSVSFPHSGDSCYLAYHYPYSYTMLMVSVCVRACVRVCVFKYCTLYICATNLQCMYIHHTYIRILHSLVTNSVQFDLREAEVSVDHSTILYHHQTLCTTLTGNPCPLITITSHHPHTHTTPDQGIYMMYVATVFQTPPY